MPRYCGSERRVGACRGEGEGGEGAVTSCGDLKFRHGHTKCGRCTGAGVNIKGVDITHAQV